MKPAPRWERSLGEERYLGEGEEKTCGSSGGRLCDGGHERNSHDCGVGQWQLIGEVKGLQVADRGCRECYLISPVEECEVQLPTEGMT